MSLIATLGVIIASAALFIVLSGFAGIKSYSLESYSKIDPDLKLFPLKGKSLFISGSECDSLNAIEGILSYSKIVEERVFIEYDNKRELGVLKGVDENYNIVTTIDSMIISGSWFTKGSNQIVSGYGISNKLSFGVLDYAKHLNLFVPKPGKGQSLSLMGMFNSLKVVNVALFDVKNIELNDSYIFSDIDTAIELLKYKDNQITGIEFKLVPDAEEDEVKHKILKLFNHQVVVKNKAQLNDALHKMLNTENVAVYLIFTLVIIIALFNIIGALIMMILDKKRYLTILYNLGVLHKDIRKIFFLIGALITVFGGGFGIVLGLIIILLQKQFNFLMITQAMPYPFEITMANISIVVTTILIFGFIASFIASNRITRGLVRGT